MPVLHLFASQACKVQIDDSDAPLWERYECRRGFPGFAHHVSKSATCTAHQQGKGWDIATTRTSSHF